MTHLRLATPADFPFIHAVAGIPEYRLYIDDVPDADLQSYLDAPDMQVLIWEQDNHPLGFALFCELDNPAGRCELRRLALAQTGKGAGQAFLRDLVSYAFDNLNKSRIWLDVVPDNPRAIRSYEKTGFVREGRMRQHWKRPTGEIVDLIVLGLLRDEWRAR
ncbi:GNAT family protein [Shimia sp.]|uniref:GNAT family N-acetyltransferase n=1 Tax=Shimia sp. TaxID=1954381 RepID=UPI00329A4432